MRVKMAGGANKKLFHDLVPQSDSSEVESDDDFYNNLSDSEAHKLQSELPHS